MLLLEALIHCKSVFFQIKLNFKSVQRVHDLDLQRFPIFINNSSKPSSNVKFVPLDAAVGDTNFVSNFDVIFQKFRCHQILQ